ncbi:MAG: HD domain-containing protein [Treponemataceae bacterium]|nr:HD domain-containing protein [Treponemataceae bacterium]
MTDSQLSSDLFFHDFPQYESEKDKFLTAEKLLAQDQIPFESRLEVAFILAENNLDMDSILTSLVADSNPKIEDQIIEDSFGNTVLKLVRNTEKINALKIKNKNLSQADSVRKMVFALADDIRVVMIELALKLKKMRSLKSENPESQKLLSQEAIEVWAPLSNRIGISAWKNEFEDLSLKYLNNEAFLQIKRIVSLKVDDRKSYLDKATEAIYKQASKANMEITVTKRAKHFYSIYQKMKKRNKSADEVLDLFAVRIICETVEDCYILMGIVHQLWKPLDGRFKDYIARPKANGYQSLHTTVMCDGKPLEIQIRTKQMHAVAEHGLASHWLYKKGSNKDSVKAASVGVVNDMKELSKNYSDESFFKTIKEEYLGKSIFVFTPNGEVKELPEGSTAIDFAYSIHSHIGQTIVGAKADGHIIQLSSPLKNTQVIEILTSPKAHPTENQLHFVKTAKARSKIHNYLQSNGLEDAPKLKEAAVSTSQEGILLAEQQRKNKELKDQAKAKDGVIKIKVGESSNFLVNLARCCDPKPGDDIVGYVSRGRGIIVHKANCPNFSHIPNIEVRTIDVAWDE